MSRPKGRGRSGREKVAARAVSSSASGCGRVSASSGTSCRAICRLAVRSGTYAASFRPAAKGKGHRSPSHATGLITTVAATSPGGDASLGSCGSPTVRQSCLRPCRAATAGTSL